MNKERQELWCHECQRYVQFDIDVSLDGKHVIVCPNCGHEHLRIVNKGIISEERWGSRNNGINQLAGGSQMMYNVSGTILISANTSTNVYVTTGVTSSVQSTYATYVGGGTGTTTDATDAFSYVAWNNFGNGNGYC